MLPVVELVQGGADDPGDLITGRVRPVELRLDRVEFGVIAAGSATIVAAFWMTSLISRVLGRIGMTIVVRVLGLILCAMAVQFIIVGVAGSTHNLVRHEIAAPYQAD